MPIKVLSISEIVLNVESIPTMRKFYETVMNFSFHSQSRNEGGTSFGDTGDPTICFLKIVDSDTPLGNNKHPVMLVLIEYRRHSHASRFQSVNTESSTLNHLAFEIAPDDFESSHDRLIELGIECSLAEFPNVAGRAIFFSDPEGNRLELICNVP